MDWNQTCCDSEIPASRLLSISEVRTVSQMMFKWTIKLSSKFYFTHQCSKQCWNLFHVICRKFSWNLTKAFHPLVVHKSTYIHVKIHPIWLLSWHILSIKHEIWVDFDEFFRWVCLLFVMLSISIVPLLFTSHKSYTVLILYFCMIYLIFCVLKHGLWKPQNVVNLLHVSYFHQFIVFSSCFSLTNSFNSFICYVN